jgi:AcrR family transcriptional regulator
MWQRASVTDRGLRREPEQLRSQEKVNRIVIAAESLLRESGYAVAVDSPNAIVERAGVTKGTFYTYFVNPESVMHHLSVRLLDRACAIADELAHLHFDSVESAIDALIERYANFYRDRAVQEIWLYHAYAVESEALDESANEYIMTRFSELLDRIDPTRAGWPRTAVLVAGQFTDHLLQYAFRVDPSGSPELIAETKRALHLYAAATRNPDSSAG